jgi:hypothetical protein
LAEMSIAISLIIKVLNSPLCGSDESRPEKSFFDSPPRLAYNQTRKLTH